MCLPSVALQEKKMLKHFSQEVIAAFGSISHGKWAILAYLALGDTWPNLSWEVRGTQDWTQSKQASHSHQGRNQNRFGATEHWQLCQVCPKVVEGRVTGAYCGLCGLGWPGTCRTCSCDRSNLLLVLQGGWWEAPLWAPQIPTSCNKSKWYPSSTKNPEWNHWEGKSCYSTPYWSLFGMFLMILRMFLI